MQDIVVLAGARTAFGEMGGGLSEVSSAALGVVAARGAMERAGVAPEQIDNVVFGNVYSSSHNDGIILARHVGLMAGCRIETPGLTVNRICGSGLQAIVSAAQSMQLGESQLSLVGGTENLSQVPHVLRGARKGFGLGQAPLQDLLWESLLDSYCGCTMSITAENLAKDYGITREECDEFALRSHKLAAAARASGRFAQEIVPVTVKTRKGQVQVDQDEHIRSDASLEGFARLKARFVENGVVTPGNASGINDGAAALVLATAAEAARLNKKPLGRIVSWGIAGVEPSRMGIGPVPAIKMALGRAGLNLGDVALVEVNEAFAAQYLAVEKALGLDRDRTNVNGGAVALGHPLGASGARLALTVLVELKARGGRYGVASLCIGGGQGIAVVFEAF